MSTSPTDRAESFSGKLLLEAEEADCNLTLHLSA